MYKKAVRLSYLYNKKMVKKITLLLVALLAVQLVQGKGFQIKVMTYNIHHCNPPAQKGVIDVDAIARVIAANGADVVFLQEVDANTGRSGKGNQAEEIAKRSGLGNFVFFKAIDFSGGDYGGAIISRYPLTSEQLHLLPVKEGEEQRIMGSAFIDITQIGQIMVATTHLDLDKNWRKLQIDYIVDFLGKQSVPVIIGGDFNAKPQSEEMKPLFENFISSENSYNPTFPNTTPTEHIDYLFISKGASMSFTGHRVLRGFDASDHLPVSAVVKFVK